MNSVTLSNAYTVAEAKEKQKAASVLFGKDSTAWSLSAMGIWIADDGELVFLFRPAEVVRIIDSKRILAIVDGEPIRLEMPADKPANKYEVPFISFSLTIQ